MIVNDLSTVPHFGFGLMRLPVTDTEDKTQIDYDQLDRMVDAFLDAGFTYFDTAYPYHGGWSERAVSCPQHLPIPELMERVAEVFDAA